MATDRPFRRVSQSVLAVVLAASVVPGAAASPTEPNTAAAMFDATSGEWHLRYPDGSVHSFAFGEPGDTPLMGDWNCDGVATVGTYNPVSGLASLRNTNSAGPPAVRLYYGIPGDTAVAGDWDGDGCDTIAIFRPSESRFYGSNQLTTTYAEFAFFFGTPGDQPLAGDFDGDGVDGVGVFRPATAEVFLRNALTTGMAETEYGYGGPRDHAFVGDWNGDGVESVAVFRPGSGRIFLREGNQPGIARADFYFGEASWVPASGPPFAEPIATLNFGGNLPPSTTTTTTVERPRSTTTTTTPSNDWIMTWGRTQDDHDRGTPLSDGARIPAKAFFYITAGDATSPPGGVAAVTWRTDLDSGYEDDGYPWRWVIRNAPAGDHWVEATINGNTRIRHSFRIAEAAATTTTTKPAPTTTTTTAPRPTTTTTTVVRRTTTTTTTPPPPPVKQAPASEDVWGLWVYGLENKLEDDRHMQGTLDQYDAVLTRWTPRTFNERMQWASDNGLKVMYYPAGTGQTREPEGWTKGPGGSRLNLDTWRQVAVDQYVKAGIDFDYWTKEGTLLGIFLIDEPTTESSWGAAIPAKTMDVDMAGYLNRFFPKTRTYVRAAPSQLPVMQYQYIDGGWSQWTWLKGFSYGPKEYRGVDWWVQKELKAADARGFDRENLVWGMAAQHGGQPNDASGFGLPTRDPYYGGSSQGKTYMRPEEILEVARAIQAAPGIGSFIFRYDTNDWNNRLPAAAQTEWSNALKTAANWAR